VPTIHRFRNVVIRMYASEHLPPHFHILGPDGAAVVEIAGLAVIARSGRIDIREALRWAEANGAVLREHWDRLNPEE
jgi:hypothetical protein